MIDRLASVARRQALNRGWIVAAFVAALAFSSAALAQSFPMTLGPDTVYGRLGAGTGPGQAIPFATLFSNLTTGNNTFAGDAYFQSGRPWCDVRATGAKGDGATNDTTAVNACITAVQALNGGTVYFPPGSYCLNGGLNITGTSSVVLQGASQAGTLLSACGADVALVTLNSRWSMIRDMSIHGSNFLTPSTTSSAVVLGSTCGACTVRDVRIQFGWFGLDNAGYDIIIDGVTIDSTYGTALSHTSNGAVYYRRVARDQNWQGTVPSAGTSISAWTGTHAYNTNDVVTLVQGGHSYYIQAQSTGTSASSAPTILPYGAGNFSDGTTSWHIVGPSTFYAQLIDGGSNVIYDTHGDFTGPFTAGISINNPNAGSVPASIHITDGTFGSYFTAAIWGQAGHDLDVKGGTMGSCVASACAGVKLSDNWTGDATIENVSIIATFNGVNVVAGKNTNIIGNRIFGGSYTSPVGVNVAANIGTISIIGNDLGSSTVNGSLQTGVNLAAGTSDFIEIAGNNCNGVIGSCVAGETGISNATGMMARNASITLGGPSGGSEGTGTINVASGYYLNGSLVSSRTKLTGTTNYYVNGNSGSTGACGPTGALTCSAGNDSNNCLTPGTACLTAQHVVNIIIGSTDLNQNLAQINLAHHTGTTNYSFQCEQGPILGNAGFAVLGDSSSPTSVVMTAPNSGNAITTRDLCIVTLKDFKIADQGSAATAIDVTQGSIVDMTDIHFGAFNSSANHVTVEGGQAKATFLASNSIDGGAATFLTMFGGGIVDFNNAAVNIGSAVAFNTSTFFASGPAHVYGMSTGTFTGAGVAGTTGTRAIMANGATMKASSGACNSVWPGNANCQITNLAYDDAADATTGNFGTLKLNGTDVTSAANMRTYTEQGMVLLSVSNISNVATLSDGGVINSTYDDYEIVLENVVPATNAAVLQLQIHSGGTYQATSYKNTSALTTAFDVCNNTTVDNTAGIGVSAAIRLYNVNNANSVSVNKLLRTSGTLVTSAAPAQCLGQGWWNGGTGVVDGFQLQESSGNLSTGTMKVYGIRKAL
jgi:hypothetical protein